MISAKEIVHDLVHAIIIPLALWLWKERSILKDVLEEKLERRHGEKETEMFNPLTALVILGEIEKALPAVQQGLSDVNQAVADKNNAAQEMIDVAKVLSDLQALITAFGIPPATPTVVVPLSPAPVIPAA